MYKLAKNFPAANARDVLIIILLVGAVFLLRMITPDDLRSRDQVKVCAYILDAAYNGNWICQVDGSGDIASKPPFYNWLGALAVLLLGASRATYALPALFGTLLATLAVWRWTLDLASDERSAWLAVLCYLATNAVFKQVALVRTDGLFTGFTSLAAWQVWRAWETDRGWWRAWSLVSLGALTKGPFALFLGFGGLTAVFWNPGVLPEKNLSPGWWHGIFLPALLGGGWALAAWWIMGEAFVDKLFIKELWGHAVGSNFGIDRFFSGIKALIYLLSRTLPWTPFFLWGIWRILRHPAAEPAERRGERFILVHIGIGLFLMMIAQHQRGDLVFPLLPAVAVIEGRMLWTFLRAWNWPKIRILLIIFTGFFFIMETWYLLIPRGRNEMVALGLENNAFIEKLEKECGLFFPFSFVSSSTLQYRLRVTRSAISPGKAAQLLAGQEAVFIVSENLPKVISALPQGVKYEVPVRDAHHPYGVISNRTRLYTEPDMVVAEGVWELHSRGVVIRRMRGTTAWIEPLSHGNLTLKNTGKRICFLKLILPDGSRKKIEAGPGANFTISTDDLLLR